MLNKSKEKRNYNEHNIIENITQKHNRLSYCCTCCESPALLCSSKNI